MERLRNCGYYRMRKILLNRSFRKILVWIVSQLASHFLATLTVLQKPYIFIFDLAHNNWMTWMDFSCILFEESIWLTVTEVDRWKLCHVGFFYRTTITAQSGNPSLKCVRCLWSKKCEWLTFNNALQSVHKLFSSSLLTILIFLYIFTIDTINTRFMSELVIFY